MPHSIIHGSICVFKTHKKKKHPLLAGAPLAQRHQGAPKAHTLLLPGTCADGVPRVRPSPHRHASWSTQRTITFGPVLLVVDQLVRVAWVSFLVPQPWATMVRKSRHEERSYLASLTIRSQHQHRITTYRAHTVFGRSSSQSDRCNGLGSHRCNLALPRGCI